ncbi:hypothetical protein J6590_078563 [Homalodisca vitripennis]|nr:hypothetical protein J6590_078563 [Homalodisca vitripennis]
MSRIDTILGIPSSEVRRHLRRGCHSRSSCLIWRSWRRWQGAGRTSNIVRIVDVTVPNEDRWHSVTTAREKKLENYAPEARLLSAEGFRTSVDAFVVESFDAWKLTAAWDPPLPRAASPDLQVESGYLCRTISGIKQWNDNAPETGSGTNRVRPNLGQKIVRERLRM